MFPRCTPDIGGTGAYWLGQNTETAIVVRWVPRIARDVPEVLEGFSRAIVLAEEWELQAVARLGVVAVSLRLEQVVPRQAVVVGDDLPVLLRVR
jgi:hypothetical protein